jgi:hypothetical protein
MVQELVEPPIDPDNEFYYRLDESENNRVQPKNKEVL